MTIYEDLAREIGQKIEQGVLKPGQRLPSVRALCKSRRISQTAVMQAYYLLEDQGFIASRPRTGYFVNESRRPELASPDAPEALLEPIVFGDAATRGELLDGMRQPGLVPLGSAFANATMFPLRRLSGHLREATRSNDSLPTADDMPPGNLQLRGRIAQRYAEMGARVDVDTIVVTTGASEALQLALFATTAPGDVVAIEMPAHYGSLHLIESTGRRAVCIPTSAREGMDLNRLELAIQRLGVKAVWATPTFQNPTGATMPADRKQEMAELLGRHGTWLIENDVYGELFFTEERPRPVKSYDTHGLVMHCGSFNKHLAPGYRVGWIAVGEQAKAVERSKFMLSSGTNVNAQIAISTFLESEQYPLHLRRLRRMLMNQRDSLLRAIARYFPPDTRVSRPDGGQFLWVQLGDPSLDSAAMAQEARLRGISFAPGALFAPDDRLRRHFRLNFGHPWTHQMEQAISTLGTFAGSGRW